ncbi:ribonuclease HI family protein [Lactobacillus sp. LC28-10]|uniref:Ribonuclease HI family protein n=1 Tax=Secundilactobacillus angelensis TaxID=2722706 RepID=A0ABX1KUY9_9LACO|nr:ribonuclease HI family protein [Secundilactobacillus angelensis]MCH5461430.1 ribonuclease HI family protein [Secundilactobacillus angelensis]NLR17757.1 ribonuclease HI family protein [Secundilactobacillus angelensis]
MYTLYTDAATNNVTNHSAAGILIVHNGVQQQLRAGLPDSDNHLAEFHAALAGFDALLQLVNGTAQSLTVQYFTDSKIVADSVEKRYAKHYQELVDQLLAKQAQFNLVITQWVPEKQNQGAHHLAQQALHEHD